VHVGRLDRFWNNQEVEFLIGKLTLKLSEVAPVLAEHSYVGGNVVQVSGPDRSFSSGAGLGLVRAGQLVPVPTLEVI